MQELYEEKLNQYSILRCMAINPSNFVFDERARLQCMTCHRFGKKPLCPPFLPSTKWFKSVLGKYTKTFLLIVSCEFNEANYQDRRNESAKLLHEKILEVEHTIKKDGNYFATSFIGGSCRLCSAIGCKRPCHQPEKGRISLEGAGIDVVRTCEKVGIQIKFPPKKHILRVGALFVK